MSINIAELAQKGETNNANAQTAEEFELVLELSKRNNPVKFAEKLASGEIDRQRQALGIAKSVEEEKVAEKVEEKPKKKINK